jgi:hypothetical protein
LQKIKFYVYQQEAMLPQALRLCLNGSEMRKKVLQAHLFEKGRNLAYLVFCLHFAKNNCAKLGIAKTGFLNPKKEGRKVKTKNRFKFPKLFL